jgi:hypothetical protein
VIGMTMVAFIFCGIRLASMKSLGGRTIRRNFLMARKAEPHLGFSREGLVTVGALLLKLGMSIDDRPRHDKLFEQVLRMRGTRQSTCNNHPDHRPNCESQAH